MTRTIHESSIFQERGETSYRNIFIPRHDPRFPQKFRLFAGQAEGVVLLVSPFPLGTAVISIFLLILGDKFGDFPQLSFHGLVRRIDSLGASED